MIFYGYDTGGSVPIDLITGLRPTLLNSPYSPNKPSLFGTGLKYAAAGGSQSFPIQPRVNTTINTNTHSLAAAFYLTALPASAAGLFGCCDTTTHTCSDFLLGLGGTADVSWSIGGANPSALLINTINVYHTIVGTCTGAATQNLYLDGKLAGTQALTSAFNGAAGQMVFNSAASTVANFNNQIVGWVYYGIQWSRMITAQEAFLLHNDPYCFLIYPEDEIWASLTGSTVAPTPGPGPNFLTSQLPMMGVG